MSVRFTQLEFVCELHQQIVVIWIWPEKRNERFEKNWKLLYAQWIIEFKYSIISSDFPLKIVGTSFRVAYSSVKQHFKPLFQFDFSYCIFLVQISGHSVIIHYIVKVRKHYHWILIYHINCYLFHSESRLHRILSTLIFFSTKLIYNTLFVTSITNMKKININWSAKLSKIWWILNGR